MFLRDLVIATNPIWPFSHLNRVPYSIAIKSFTRACRQFPQIKSVYLRDGMVRGDWIPGISDIDITLVIDAGLEAQEEFVFLTMFWNKYSSLKKIFPMLGEVEILDERQIKAWTKYGIRGYESKNWKLLYGIPTTGNNYKGSTAEDAFKYALRCHGLFLKEMSKLAADPIRLQRYAVKVLRYANYNQEGKWRETVAGSKNVPVLLNENLKKTADFLKLPREATEADKFIDLAATALTHPRRKRTIMPPECADFPVCGFFQRMLKELLYVISVLRKETQAEPDIRQDRSNYECYLLLRNLANEAAESF